MQETKINLENKFYVTQKQRVTDHGEVFTAQRVVNAINRRLKE